MSMAEYISELKNTLVKINMRKAPIILGNCPHRTGIFTRDYRFGNRMVGTRFGTQATLFTFIYINDSSPPIVANCPKGTCTDT